MPKVRAEPVVRDVMSKDVATTRHEYPLLEALVTMRKRGISGLPVIDTRGTVVGVISERDIVRLIGEATGDPAPGSLLNMVLVAGDQHAKGTLKPVLEFLKTRRVSEAMSSAPVTISPGASLRDAARAMLERKVNRLPVVDKGKLVGVVTRYDIIVNV